MQMKKDSCSWTQMFGIKALLFSLLYPNKQLNMISSFMISFNRPVFCITLSNLSTLDVFGCVYLRQNFIYLNCYLKLRLSCLIKKKFRLLQLKVLLRHKNFKYKFMRKQLVNCIPVKSLTAVFFMCIKSILEIMLLVWHLVLYVCQKFQKFLSFLTS